MACKFLVHVIVGTLILGATLHAQIGPISVVAEKKQLIARVPTSKVVIKQLPKLGTVTIEPDVVAAETAHIFYTARDLKETTPDAFSYVADATPEQVVQLRIVPATFDLDQEAYEKIFKVLFLLFILAIVLESGLALLFNWRPFVETFNSRATKPLVSFVFAYLFIVRFDLDLMSSILAAASTRAPAPSGAGRFITAMVLAGGSAGINNMLIALGFRQLRTPDTVTPKPSPTTAWIAFQLHRVRAVGPVEVKVGPTPAAPNDPLPVAGVIHGASRPGVRFFLRDPGRFPTVAGYSVPPDSPLTYELVGKDKDGNAVTTAPRQIVIAPGAIIDLEVQL